MKKLKRVELAEVKPTGSPYLFGYPIIIQMLITRPLYTVSHLLFIRE